MKYLLNFKNGATISIECDHSLKSLGVLMSKGKVLMTNNSVIDFREVFNILIVEDLFEDKEEKRSGEDSDRQGKDKSEKENNS